MSDEPCLSRRTFCAALGAAILAPGAALAAPQAPLGTIGLHNIHTGENLDLPDRPGLRQAPEHAAALNRFFRCHYTGEAAEIDPAAVEALCEVHRALGTRARIRVISGYRSPAYNELLRRLGRKVAKHSLHTRGLAIDFAIPGAPNARVARAARSLGVGGVGVYRDFVHIDTGPVRFWRG